MNADLTSKKDIKELIMRVLTDQATSDESVRLHEWVNKYDENKQFFLQLRTTWQASSQVVPPDTLKTLKALDTVNKRINPGQPSIILSSHKNSSANYIQSFSKYLKTAAVWILLFSLGAVTSYLFIKPSGYFKSSLVTVVAPMGSKAMTILPDGSNVWLNAGSKIIYSMPDKQNIREISLTGEAYFNVSKDPDNMFVVNAGGIIIKAYGTEFNVKAYPEENVVETTLVEGSVSVEVKNKPSDRIMLNPNEQVSYYKATSDRSENLLVTKGIDPALFTLWINDRMQIRGVRLEDLAIMLERKYDVKIHFEDSSLKDLRFTGFIENETIEQILELIKISSYVDYRIDEREIWLMKTLK